MGTLKFSDQHCDGYNVKHTRYPIFLSKDTKCRDLMVMKVSKLKKFSGKLLIQLGEKKEGKYNTHGHYLYLTCKNGY